MPPSPEPQSNRKRLTVDELIAVIVALTSIGAIFFWSISQTSGTDAPLLQLLTAQPTLSPSPTPLSTPTPSSPPAPPPATTAAPVIPSPSPTVAPETAAPLSQAVPLIAAAPLLASRSPQPSTVPSPVTPAPSATPVGKPKQFADVPNGYWASASIAALSARGILGGFPDGKFYPNRPITRVQFAEIVQKAFNEPAKRTPLKFSDIKADNRALAAINQATQTGFMNGFPDGRFIPDREIPRLQVLLALATGLDLQPKAPIAQTLGRYRDAGQIPAYATDRIAAATEAGLVLNDSTPNQLNPNQITTRAEAAALVYEALQRSPQ